MWIYLLKFESSLPKLVGDHGAGAPPGGVGPGTDDDAKAVLTVARGHFGL